MFFKKPPVFVEAEVRVSRTVMVNMICTGPLYTYFGVDFLEQLHQRYLFRKHAKNMNVAFHPSNPGNLIVCKSLPCIERGISPLAMRWRLSGLVILTNAGLDKTKSITVSPERAPSTQHRVTPDAEQPTLPATNILIACCITFNKSESLKRRLTPD